MWISTAFAAQAVSRTGSVSSSLGNFFSTFPLWIAAGTVFLGSFVVAAAVKKIVSFRIAQKAQHELSREVIILIERAVWFTIVMLGTILAFGIVGINIATLVGFLGLGIGFAFKDLLSNFIAGVVVLTQKKFHIGDTVNIGGTVGKIVEIETRTTQIQDFDGIIHIIPNANLLVSVIQNYSTNSFRRICFQVGVHYDTPLAEAIELAMKSVTSNHHVVPEPKTAILVTLFGDSAITLDVRFWVEAMAPWPKIQSEVMQKLKKDFDKAGISIPFPMRTLTLDPYDRNIMQAFNVPFKEDKFSFPTEGKQESQEHKE